MGIDTDENVKWWERLGFRLLWTGCFIDPAGWAWRIFFIIVAVILMFGFVSTTK